MPCRFWQKKALYLNAGVFVIQANSSMKLLEKRNWKKTSIISLSQGKERYYAFCILKIYKDCSWVRETKYQKIFNLKGLSMCSSHIQQHCFSNISILTTWCYSTSCRYRWSYLFFCSCSTWAAFCNSCNRLWATSSSHLVLSSWSRRFSLRICNLSFCIRISSCSECWQCNWCSN